MRMARSVNAAVALIAFAATCAIIHVLLPIPELGALTVKLRFLAAHRDDYDTIFIGSSRTFHGISPAVFDATMASAGFRHHSFNFGGDGVWPPEQFYLLDKLIQMHPRNWRWVFIEMDDVQVELPPQVRGTERSVYWHNLPSTWIIFRKLLALGRTESPARKLNRFLRWSDVLWLHSGLLLRNFANVGHAESIWQSCGVNRSADLPSTDELGPQRDGYDPLPARLTAAERIAYDAWLANDLRRSQRKSLDSYADQTYRRYAQQFRELGATAVFYVTPGSMQLLPARFGDEPAPLVLAFNDAVAYPALYRPDVRGDESHLNDVGAAEFSRLLAEQFMKASRTAR